MKKSFLFLIGLVLINVISIFLFFRKDLTEEKRYSLSDASKNMVSNLEEPIVIEVLLDGAELPGGFERLKQAISETLEGFKTYGGANVEYSFFDPNSISDSEQRNQLIDSLYSKGVQPTNIFNT
jgi:ABC-2 type transport system permease protein